jgi:hypothetical protein
MLRLVLLRLMESYFRHRWLYLAPIFLMMLAGGLSLYLAKPEYTAKGVLFVQKESLLAKLTSVKGTDFSWQTPALITVGELKGLLQTDAFVRAAIKETDFEKNMDGGTKAVNETIDKVRKAVWVVSDGDNQVRIGAVNEQPALALQMANGVIDTFLQWKITGDRSESEAAHTFFTEIITKYKSEVDVARQNLYDYLNAHPEPIKGNRPNVEQLEVSRLQNELDLAQKRYASALDKDENAQLATAQAEGDVSQSYILIDAPSLPDNPETSLKQIVLQFAVFATAGVFLSLLGVVGGALLDRSFRFPIDIWHGIQLPVLAAVPNIALTSKGKKMEQPKKARRRRKEEAEPVSRNGEVAPGGAYLNVEEVSSAATSSTSPMRREKIKRGKASKNPVTPSVDSQPIEIGLRESEAVQMDSDVTIGYTRYEDRK